MCKANVEVLVQKMLTKALDTGSPLQSWIKKTIHQLEMRWLSGKENVPDTVVSKEGHAYSLLKQNMEGPITIDFLEKSSPVNSVSCCQIFWQSSPYLLNDPHIHIY